MFGVQSRIAAFPEDVGVRNQLGQVSVTLPGFGQQGQVGAVFQCHLGAADRLDPRAAGHLGKVHGAAKVVVVGNGQGPVPQIPGAHHQFLYRGCPLLEGIVGVTVQFRVGNIHVLFAHFTTTHHSSLHLKYLQPVFQCLSVVFKCLRISRRSFVAITVLAIAVLAHSQGSGFPLRRE